MNAPGSTTCKTCGLPRASRAWFFFRDAAESHEPCRAARRYERRSARVRDRELDAKLEALRGGTGCQIVGGPGNGKSFMATRLLDELEAEGHTVHRMSRTHATARTIRGLTTNRWLNVHQKYLKPSIVFVDEIYLREYDLV